MNINEIIALVGISIVLIIIFIALVFSPPGPTKQEILVNRIRLYTECIDGYKMKIFHDNNYSTSVVYALEDGVPVMCKEEN